MERPNQEIRNLIKESQIHYWELLEYIPSPQKGKKFSHVQRIFEDLNRPFDDKRKQEYLLAIDKIIQRRKMHED